LVGGFLLITQPFCLASENGAKTKPLTLADCYVLALKQSEIIAIDAERLNEAEGHFLQALSELLPHVNFVSTEFRGRPKGSTSNGSEQKFVFKQNLFSGFKEIAAVSGSHLERDQRTNEKLRAEQLLFADVSDAFYLLIEIREDLKALGTIRGALKDRVKELLTRERLGRSRRSEVVNTEAQLYAVVARYESIKSLQKIAEQLVEFLIGKPVGDLTDTQVLPVFLKPESEYIQKANKRPDVLAVQKAWEISKKAVVVAKSGFFPTVTLENSYYMHRSIAPTDEEWAATLKIDMPVFQGTETWGGVKVANSQSRQAELTLSRTRRIAAQDIRDSYTRFESGLLESQAFKRALSAAEMNYIFQKKDYKFSLVNNIAVLDAIQTWQDSKRNYVHAFYEAKRRYNQLLVASGEAVTGE
jgi:outer membrane protein